MVFTNRELALDVLAMRSLRDKIEDIAQKYHVDNTKDTQDKINRIYENIDIALKSNSYLSVVDDITDEDVVARVAALDAD